VTVPGKEDPPEAAVSALLENQAMEVPVVQWNKPPATSAFLQAPAYLLAFPLEAAHFLNLQ
jgi:hypothetical protein